MVEFPFHFQGELFFLSVPIRKIFVQFSGGCLLQAIVHEPEEITAYIEKTVFRDPLLKPVKLRQRFLRRAFLEYRLHDDQVFQIMKTPVIGYFLHDRVQFFRISRFPHSCFFIHFLKEFQIVSVGFQKVFRLCDISGRNLFRGEQ